MCSACGFPPAVGHWTDAGGQTPAERLRIRFQRIAVLNSLLDPMGLRTRDTGALPGIQVFDKTGRIRLCHTLEDVWSEVEVLSGTAVDPLRFG